MRPILLLLSAGLLAACSSKEPPPAPLAAETTAKVTAAAPLPPTSTATPPGRACWSLVDTEEPDVVRTLPDGRVLHASARAGLALHDVSDGAPRTLATAPFSGVPLGVFALEEVAVVVYAPWDHPGTTVVRAIAIAPGAEGRPLGELTLRGRGRDARRIGDAIVVTRDLLDPGAPLTEVASFHADARGLVAVDAVRLPGAGALAAASPYGLAVLRPADATASGPDRTAITWVAISPERPGRLHVEGTRVVDGVIPAWRTAQDHLVDVTEDAHVRLFACATATCASGDDAIYAALDFGKPLEPRLLGSARIARAGDAVVRFLGNDAVVARAPNESRAAHGTELVFLHATDALVPFRTLRIAGTVGSLAAHGKDLLAIGWTGSPGTGTRAVVHRVKLEGGPWLAGTATFGGDFAWSPAFDGDRALGFDEARATAALPLTGADPATGAPRSVVALFALPPTGLERRGDLAVDDAERVVLDGDRVLVFGADGLRVRPLGGADPAAPAAVR